MEKGWKGSGRKYIGAGALDLFSAPTIEQPQPVVPGAGVDSVVTLYTCYTSNVFHGPTTVQASALILDFVPETSLGSIHHGSLFLGAGMLNLLGDAHGTPHDGTAARAA